MVVVLKFLATFWAGYFTPLVDSGEVDVVGLLFQELRGLQENGAV